MNIKSSAHNNTIVLFYQ